MLPDLVRTCILSAVFDTIQFKLSAVKLEFRATSPPQQTISTYFVCIRYSHFFIQMFDSHQHNVHCSGSYDCQ
jgi:hypothetical protein